MGLGNRVIYKNKLGLFVSVSVILILFPGTLKNKQATAFTFTPPASVETIIEQESDSISFYQTLEQAVAFRKQNESIQGSSMGSSTSTNNAENALPLVVTTQVQAENLFDQGYSVSDIAKELQISKKEVRKLKKRLRKEEKAAIQQRKKIKKKNDTVNS
ncbi:helix-turn-helix domain-containing protein [Rhodocytophaga rosea]|uniref:Helix-turn-helix domain-containing protein n=1 Tax=Rhodocytophaga rosea TaxID=2704465 RepID=A0A6C0GBR5_9BACT|nr:helix-turn-helix domain-containing protein [Rhodocytophaga rosea]QHT65419.1 helix-turn-helix domain-containing protein [Rhodocytophaga rosea]